MHRFANPARFLKIARPATVWLFVTGLILAAVGVIGGLALSSPDYLQGETVRIMYVHVPAAWLGMGGWAGLAVASLRSRASTLADASTVRIRISTIAPNISEKPSVVKASGQRISGAIVEPFNVMLGPWCSEFHHTTERLMIGTLTAPIRPKIAVAFDTLTFSSPAFANAI